MIGNRQQLEPQQKKKTNATIEAETESIAETCSAKTVATIATKRTTARTTATNKITEDKSQGFFNFTVPFYIMFDPIFKLP